LRDPTFNRFVQCRLVTDGRTDIHRQTHDDSIHRASIELRYFIELTYICRRLREEQYEVEKELLDLLEKEIFDDN